MALPKLSKLTYDELSVLAKRIEKLRARKKRQEKNALLNKFKRLAKQKGLSIDDVIGENATKKPIRKRAKVAPKYRNPDDSSQTWSGRGRKPLWVVAALEKGTSMKKLEI